MVTLSEGFSVSSTNIGSAYTWNESVNSFSTNASGKVVQSSGAVRVALCTTPLASSDQDVSIQAEGNGAGIALRFTNGDFSGSYSGYRVRINGNTVQVYRWFADFVAQVSVSGGISYPGTLRATIVNNGSGDPAIEIFWNGVSQGTITDTNAAKVTSGLYVGIANQNTASITDDWTAQDIGVSTVTGTIVSDLPFVTQSLAGSAGSGIRHFSDDFNRANSTSAIGGSISWATSGVGGTPTWGISSNAAYLVATGGASRSFATFDSGFTDKQTVEAWVSPSLNGHGLVLRYTDPNNYVIVIQSSTFGTLTVLQRVSGTETTVATFSLSLAEGIRAEVEGTTLKVYRRTSQTSGWSYVGSATISTALTGTRVGLAASITSSTRFDNFVAHNGVNGSIVSDLPGVDQELLGPIADTGLSEPFSVSSDSIGSAYTWTESVNSLTTNASGRVVSSSSAIRVAFPNQSLSSPNHKAQVEAHTLMTGVTLRFSDGDFSGSYTGYWVRINSTHVQLFRWFSSYVGQVALPGTPTFPGTLAAEIKNNLDTGNVDVEVFWNGASLGVITDSSLDKLQTGRWAGIFFNAVDAELDNWAAQDTIVESGGSLSPVLAVPIGGGSSASGVTYFSGKIRRSGSTKFSHASVRDGAWLRSKVRGR